MLRRMAFCMALAALALASRVQLAAQENEAPSRAPTKRATTEKKPAVVFRLASIDHLMTTVRYLAEVSGHEDQAKNLEGMIKNAAGPKGLEGIDTKKPLGVYAYIGAQGIDSDVVVLIPYSDQDAFLDLLERQNQNQKPEKEDDGTYKVQVKNAPFSLYLRFANKYVYACNNQERVKKEKLLEPAAVLPPGQGGTAELLVRINQIPEELRGLALGFLENRLAKEKDSKKGETEAEAKLRETLIDETAQQLKAILNNGNDLHLSLDLDRDASDLSLSLSLTGEDGSTLARNISNLGRIQSLASSLVGKESAASLLLHVSLPEPVRQALLPVLQEQKKKAVAKEKDETKRELAEATWKTLEPTLEQAILDAGFDMRGPGAGGLYTLVAGFKVKDGKDIDKLVRQVKSKLPEENEDLKLDVDKEGSIAIHQVRPKKQDKNAVKTFGDNPIFFAVREDAVLMSMGQEGLSALKEVLGVAPRTGSVFQFEMAFSRLAPLMTDKYKSAVEVARKTLKEKGADRVVITLEGGKKLKLRLGMKAQLLAFFSQLNERGSEEAQENK